MNYIEPLLQPLTIKTLNLPNRLVMAPMSRYKSNGGIPDAAVARYYQRRAEGGVGLIITEGTVVGHKASQGEANVPAFYGDNALAGWQKVVEAVHKAGGKIFPQLWHVGGVRQLDTPPDPNVPGYSASEVIHPHAKNQQPSLAMTSKDIDEVIIAFVEAAMNAKRLGFDGIELHGAHGYLIDQFFWAYTNQRLDNYGGKTLQARAQFAVELVKSIRSVVGNDFPIGFRISQWKLSAYEEKMAKIPQELEQWLMPLVLAGVDIFHCSTRRFYEPEFSNSKLNLAGWVKKVTGKPTITVGSVGLNIDFITNKRLDEVSQLEPKNLEVLMAGLERGDFDLVAVGRALLADPQWLQKISERKFDQIKMFTKEALQQLY